MPSGLVAELAAIVGPDGMVDAPAARAVYECDGYTLERAVPELVVLPRSTDEVARVLRAAWRACVPFVPRGAGTGLSGGCLAAPAPLVVCTSRMRAIRSVDVANRRIVAGRPASRKRDLYGSGRTTRVGRSMSKSATTVEASTRNASRTGPCNSN